MILVSHFFFGFIFSFLGSITPSMLNMTALKISLENGKEQLNKYAIGVSVVVIPQAYIAIFLIKHIVENPSILEILEKIGIVIFIFLSYYFYRESKKSKIKIETTAVKKENAFLAGITLSVLNMFSIPFFCGLVATLDVFKLFSFNIITITFFVLGSVIGTFYILYLYGKFAKIIQKKTGELTKDINLVLSILTGLVAAFTIIKSLI
jgi:threonine/homoserine/homoserine lactone efflux protein